MAGVDEVKFHLGQVAFVGMGAVGQFRAERDGSFAPGRWSPHITIARRMPTAKIGAAVAALGDSGRELESRVRQCRRWDGHRRLAWWISNTPP